MSGDEVTKILKKACEDAGFDQISLSSDEALERLRAVAAEPEDLDLLDYLNPQGENLVERVFTQFIK